MQSQFDFRVSQNKKDHKIPGGRFHFDQQWIMNQTDLSQVLSEDAGYSVYCYRFRVVLNGTKITCPNAVMKIPLANITILGEDGRELMSYSNRIEAGMKSSLDMSHYFAKIGGSGSGVNFTDIGASDRRGKIDWSEGQSKFAEFFRRCFTKGGDLIHAEITIKTDCFKHYVTELATDCNKLFEDDIVKPLENICKQDKVQRTST